MGREKINICLFLFLSCHRLSLSNGSSTPYTTCPAAVNFQKPLLSTPSTMSPCFAKTPSINYISRSGNKIDKFITESLKLSIPAGAILEVLNLDKALILSPTQSNLVNTCLCDNTLTKSSSTLPTDVLPLKFNPSSLTCPTSFPVSTTNVPQCSENVFYSSSPNTYDNLITCLTNDLPDLSSQCLSSLDSPSNPSISLLRTTELLDIPVTTSVSSSQYVPSERGAAIATQDLSFNSGLLSPFSTNDLVQTPCLKSASSLGPKLILKPSNLKIVSTGQSPKASQTKSIARPLKCKNTAYSPEVSDLPRSSPICSAQLTQSDVSSTISTQDIRQLPCNGIDSIISSNVLSTNSNLYAPPLLLNSCESSSINSATKPVKVKSANLKMMPEFVCSSDNSLKGVVQPLKCKGSSNDVLTFDLPLKSPSETDFSSFISTPGKMLHTSLISLPSSGDNFGPTYDLTQPSLRQASPQPNSFSFSEMTVCQNTPENLKLNLDLLSTSSPSDNLIHGIVKPMKKNFLYNREDIENVEADLSIEEMLRLIRSMPNIEESVSHLFDNIDFTNPEVIADFVALLKQLLIKDIIENN